MAHLQSEFEQTLLRDNEINVSAALHAHGEPWIVLAVDAPPIPFVVIVNGQIVHDQRSQPEPHPMAEPAFGWDSETGFLSTCETPRERLIYALGQYDALAQQQATTSVDATRLFDRIQEHLDDLNRREKD